MRIQLLANHTASIPVIAQWYFNEWGDLRPNNSPQLFAESLEDYLNTDKMPLMVVATEGNTTLGVAQLKYREMDIYPEKEHWLGGVYVGDQYRGNNIAEKIIDSILDHAGQFGVRTLYLQTKRLDGGLYKSLGWQPVEQVNYYGLDVLVMTYQLS